jgi:ATP citrate (pro-S)-lyase
MPFIKLSEYTAKKIYSSDWNIRRITRDDIGSDHLGGNPAKYILKVDEFVKRRGKKGLIRKDIETNESIDQFLMEKKDYNNFVLEKQIGVVYEKYFCIYMKKGKKQYIFHHQGGVDCDPNIGGITSDSISGLGIILPGVSVILEKLDTMFDLIDANYLEVNPLVMDSMGNWIPVDFAVKVDSCGLPFWDRKYLAYMDDRKEVAGNDPTEAKIRGLDESSGASLKFKKLNPDGNILTLIAGGGASVLFTDAIVNRGMAGNLYNYGEYSGNPSFDETYAYCSLIFEDWLRNSASDRILIIGGGISNFTDVAQTFKGIIRAIEESRVLFVKLGVRVFVRRGGVNEAAGLKMIREKLELWGIPIIVKGTEYPITQIVTDIFPRKIRGDVRIDIEKPEEHKEAEDNDAEEPDEIALWNDKIIFAGNHAVMIQRVIDYDYYVGKNEPDIVCIYDEFVESKTQTFFWGTKRIGVPITNSISKISELLGAKTATVYNYASIRSYEAVILKLVGIANIRTFYVIAEGIPERKTIAMREFLKKLGKSLLGPSSVGAIKAGVGGQRIGNVGGLMEHIQKVNLAQYGNVAVITKSGGLLNEMIHFCNNMGLVIGEAVSIGGDAYCGIGFADLVKYYESVDNIKLVIMLGETGGTAEIDAAGWWNRNSKKMLVGWCSGTSEKSFGEQIEFGHAGASAGSSQEEANYKNNRMRELGLIVPETFEELGAVLVPLIHKLVPKESGAGRNVPMDIGDAIKGGIVRINPSIVTKMTDERTDLKYRGEVIDEVVARKFSIGYTVANLWLNCRVDDWAAEFIEKCLVIMADHGPAVSGAQNTIITARAGKGLVESLVSGLLTIGPRFGGAIADAARDFYGAWKVNEGAANFVGRKKKEGKMIMGIGHRVKSKYNPDKRVEVIRKLVDGGFPAKRVFSFALEVEKETLAKKANLILNVDGAIGAALADILINYGRESSICEGDILNGFFVLARTIGFIGHYNEQRNNGLFRANSWDVDYE